MIYNDNGAPTLHGRGLENVKQKIMDAFDAVRMSGAPPAPPEVVVYLEEHFKRHTESLTAAALASSHVMAEVTGPIHVVVPTESAEELFQMLDDLNHITWGRRHDDSRLNLFATGADRYRSGRHSGGAQLGE